MISTNFGITISGKEVQFWKADPPIAVRFELASNVTFDKLEQYWNTLSHSSVTDLGIVICSKIVFLNELNPMILSDESASNVTVDKPEQS